MKMQETAEKVDYISMLSPAEREAFNRLKRPIANEDLFSLGHLKECIAFYPYTEYWLQWYFIPTRARQG